MSQASLDSAVFAAVIRDLMKESMALILVDPRPLRGDTRIAVCALVADSGLVLRSTTAVEPAPASLVNPNESHLAPVSAEVLARRRITLRNLRVEETDGLRPAPCPDDMNLIPRPTPGMTPLDSAGCPREPRRIVLTSPAREISPSRLDAPSREGGRAGMPLAAIRVVVREESPRGRMTRVDDYMLQRDPRGVWRVDRKVKLLIVE